MNGRATRLTLNQRRLHPATKWALPPVASIFSPETVEDGPLIGAPRQSCALGNTLVKPAKQKERLQCMSNHTNFSCLLQFETAWTLLCVTVALSHSKKHTTSGPNVHTHIWTLRSVPYLSGPAFESDL